MSRELKPCGTPAAYRRHLRHDEEPCEACRAAESARTCAAYRVIHPDAKPKPDGLQPCGTPAGYARHRDRGEVTCAACRKAWAADVKARRIARSAS